MGKFRKLKMLNHHTVKHFVVKISENSKTSKRDCVKTFQHIRIQGQPCEVQHVCDMVWSSHIRSSEEDPADCTSCSNSNLPQELLVIVYTDIIQSVTCTSITVRLVHKAGHVQTATNNWICREDHRGWPSLDPGPVQVLYQEKGWKHLCRRYTSWIQIVGPLSSGRRYRVLY